MALSQHFKNRQIERRANGTYIPFTPDLKRWIEMCKVSAYDTQIYRAFNICADTFYAFLDREYFKQEEDAKYKSPYLTAYVDERDNTRQFIASSFLKKIKEGDTASILFGMKTYNGLIEAKDIKHIEIKKREVTLRSKHFLVEMAQKFGLSYDQLNSFAEKYFTVKMNLSE